MILKDILAISGQSGLYKFIAQGKNAIIVEHLETKQRSSAFGSAKVSSLDEISVFTEKEDMPLGKVFDLIHEKENGGPAIDAKTDPDKLKSYFSGVLPEYSKDRVYTSDIKKVVQWYNILQKLNLLVKEEPEKPAEPETGKKKEAEAKKMSAPKKKVAEVKKISGTKKKEAEARKTASPKKKEAETKKVNASGKKEAASRKTGPASKIKTSKPKEK